MDKAQLLQRRIPERDVDIPGVGTVRVRGLSRGEALEVQKLNGDVPAMEREVLRFGLVDPVLTDAEVAEWYQSTPANEIEPVTQAIIELSGLGEGATKSGVPAVRG